MAIKLIVAYPRPTNIDEKVYQQEHVPLAIRKLEGKTKIVATKIIDRPGCASVLPDRRNPFPLDDGVGSLCRLSRRKGNARACGEDLLGWAARNHDCRGGMHLAVDFGSFVIGAAAHLPASRGRESSQAVQ
jgi:hypothetical protein